MKNPTAAFTAPLVVAVANVRESVTHLNAVPVDREEGEGGRLPNILEGVIITLCGISASVLALCAIAFIVLAARFAAILLESPVDMSALLAQVVVYGLAVGGIAFVCLLFLGLIFGTNEEVLEELATSLNLLTLKPPHLHIE